jgi:hypothetical protein
MRLIARPFLWLLTSIVPVFIAACYGTGGFFDEPYNLLRARGRVLNAATGKGIKGIRVTCVAAQQGLGTDYGEPIDGGFAFDETYSLPGDGAFEIWFDSYNPCIELRLEDVDGEENDGLFVGRDIEFPEVESDRQDIVVELSPKS